MAGLTFRIVGKLTTVSSARFPIVGSLTNRNPNAAIADTKDQLFDNCFPEVVQNPLTNKSEIWLNKRQGTTASSDVQASATASFGAVVWTANSAAVAPGLFSYLKSSGAAMMIFNTAGTQIGGDIANTNQCMSLEETDVSGTGNLTAALLDNGTSAVEAWFFPEGGAWTQITDAQFPSSVTPAHAHMDGYMFVMTEGGQLWNSDLNSLSAWTAATFISANSFADNGVGCARYRNLIVGFGDYSTEFFYNAGNATGSVLSRVENATLRVGAIRHTTGRGTAIKSIGNTVYWIGINADTGAKGVYRLNGMQAEKVSNAAVDKLVGNGVIRSILGSFSLLGFTHIAFGAGTTSSVCYCQDTNFWWYLTPAGSLNVSAMISAADSSAYAKSYFSTVTNAKIYTFDPNSPVWQDNASAYTMTARTDNMDMGTHKRKFWKSVAILGDTESSGQVNIAHADDDFVSFTTDRALTTNDRLLRLGSSRRRSWRITHNANAPCRLQAIEIEYEVGSS